MDDDESYRKREKKMEELPVTRHLIFLCVDCQILAALCRNNNAVCSRHIAVTPVLFHLFPLRRHRQRRMLKNEKVPLLVGHKESSTRKKQKKNNKNMCQSGSETI